MIVDLSEARDNGLCDRLRAVTYFMALARLTGDDRIELYEPLSNHCPYKLTDSVLLDGLTLSPWEGPLPENSRDLPPDASPELRFARRYRPRDVDVSAKTFLRHWIASYPLIKPNAWIEKRVDVLPLSRRTLGIHVRRTDKVREWPGRYELTASEAVRAERDMEQLIRRKAASGAVENVFIASDCADGKSEWTERMRGLGLPVVVHEAAFHADRVRHTDASDFFVDLFALSRCGVIVGNVRSGVGISASHMGGVAEFYTMSDPNMLAKHRLLERIGRRVRRLFIRG